MASKNRAGRHGGGRRIAGPRRKNSKDQAAKKFHLFLEKNQAFPIDTKITKITLNDGTQDYPMEFDEKPKYIKSCNVFYVKTPRVEISSSEKPPDNENPDEVKIRQEDQIIPRNKKVEKKFRAQMIKNGLPREAQFKGMKVTFDLIREVWTQEQAELFRVPGGYLIFGHLDLQNRQQTEAKKIFDQQIKDLNFEQMAADGVEPPDLVAQEEGPTQEEPAAEEGPTEEGSTVPEGVRMEDLDLIMGQASCTREQAIAALKANQGDIVNSIMALS